MNILKLFLRNFLKGRFTQYRMLSQGSSDISDIINHDLLKNS